MLCDAVASTSTTAAHPGAMRVRIGRRTPAGVDNETTALEHRSSKAATG